MKKILFISSLAILFSCNNKEELSVKTEKLTGSEVRSTFKVWGNCDMCQETIEGSLKTDGVNTAHWDTESKMIEVNYDTTRISLDQVEQKIAAAGYDNVKYKGDDKAYEGLPECCHYERK